MVVVNLRGVDHEVGNVALLVVVGVARDAGDIHIAGGIGDGALGTIGLVVASVDVDRTAAAVGGDG